MVLDARSEAFRDLVAPGAELERLATGFDFVEGPAWSAAGEFLVFSDIPADTIVRWDEGGTSVWRRPSNKANGLAYDPAGNLLACEHSTSRVSRTGPDGTVTTVVSQWQGKELNSPNDVAVRSDGTVYFTDPSDGRTSDHWGLVRPRQIDFHGVYAVLPGGEAILLADDFLFPNGVCLSPDERVLYVNDTTRMHVRAFDVRPDGTVEGDRVFLEQEGTGRMEDGVPDGMKTDEHGNLWATGPFGVWVASPEGEVLGIVRTPEFAANVCWGGGGWNELYVTATHSLYRLETSVRGAPAPTTR
jgi:gluconolactonase